MSVGAVSSELGCQSKRETLVKLLGVPRESETPYELGGPSKREAPINYSGYQALSVTILVVQESGRLSSTTRGTKNLGNILRMW